MSNIIKKNSKDDSDDKTNECIYNDDDFNSEDLVNAFYEYASENFKPYDLKSKKEREIELVFKNPSFSVFTNLYNYKKSEMLSYIEVVSHLSKDIKTRWRKPLTSFSYYINNKNELLECFRKDRKESKYLINKEKYKNMFIFKTAEECMGLNDNNKTSFSFYFVNSIKKSNSYFEFEARLKTRLQVTDRKSNDLIISYFNEDNDNRQLSVEIELNQRLTTLDEKTFKQKFRSILSQGLAISQTPFYFSTTHRENIKTNMINIGELLELDPSKHIVTAKVDGVSKPFRVKNSICFIETYNVVIEYETNIPKEYEISGTGEFVIVNEKRIIYPFWIKAISKNGKDITFTTRKESFEIVEKIIDESLPCNNELKKEYTLGDKIGILFGTKKFLGPFDTIHEMLDTCQELSLKTYVYNTDGLILINNDNLENIVDYKFKQKNTIDVYTNFNLPKESSENTSLMDFNFFLFLKSNASKIYIPYERIEQSNSNNFFYDTNLSMLVYKQNNHYEVYPVNFITELDITDKTFKPRLDKTCKMYESSYRGNNFPVIMNSIVLHKYKLAVQQGGFADLKNIKDYGEYAKEIKATIADKVKKEISLYTDIYNNQGDNVETLIAPEIENLIVKPINGTKNWYKSDTDTSKRRPINILCNLNKTEGINFAIGPFVNTDTRYKSLFSIYAGQGGDIGKFVTNGITSVVAIDPDVKALAQFNKRHKSYSEKQRKIFNLKTIPLALEDKDFLIKVKKEVGEVTFDVIECQLGIHFSFRDEIKDHIGDILVALSNRGKKIKTRVLISTNDADRISQIFKERNSDVVQFKIRPNSNSGPDEETIYQISKKPDNKLGVFYSSSMNEEMEEYLIHKESFVKFMESRGFILRTSWNFAENIADNKIYEHLLSRWMRESSGKFLGQLKDVDLTNKDLLDVISIFRYYIFESKY